MVRLPFEVTSGSLSTSGYNHHNTNQYRKHHRHRTDPNNCGDKSVSAKRQVRMFRPAACWQAGQVFIGANVFSAVRKCQDVPISDLSVDPSFKTAALGTDTGRFTPGILQIVAFRVF